MGRKKESAEEAGAWDLAGTKKKRTGRSEPSQTEKTKRKSKLKNESP